VTSGARRAIGTPERVANDRRRDEVRDLLNSAGLTAKVAVYPPWFVPKVAVYPPWFVPKVDD
jgi:hypothetical protein